ncbi:30S ribosomal protein S9 [Candidatus Micrarchaeota archaeon]|nr:30S ribosomal protein S9 [Candidatus Micrarchaeota archaeon]
MAEKKTTEKKKAAPKKKAAKKEEKAEPSEAAKEAPKESKPEAKVQVLDDPKDAPKSVKENSATKKPAKKAKKKKKGTQVEHARGKRKKAIARATVKEGSGRIRVNSRLVSASGNKYFKGIVEEPLLLLGPDGLKVDVNVSVRGGGEMGQAQACRTAIARALAQYFGEGIAAKFKEDDTYLLREDPRRVEPKKYKGRKARARFQKSYR